MKQKMVLKVTMICQKCRTKALEIVADSHGVTFLGLEGDNKEKVVVIGDGFDAVAMVAKLRKKVGHTEIVSLGAA
ncbi:hypothetical protein K2173_025762 [Erythroxylum novogranatense]|uniref:HMA domain-containing protein n=1 Tax=Erythroxylum novogranatense TaxID=1862640 RepID=A0AAV8T450_9ROSI|nr:hypothetical protein K2173_025762 [Erythroxylum novogranatense]